MDESSDKCVGGVDLAIPDLWELGFQAVKVHEPPPPASFAVLKDPGTDPIGYTQASPERQPQAPPLSPLPSASFPNLSAQRPPRRNSASKYRDELNVKGQCALGLARPSGRWLVTSLALEQVPRSERLCELPDQPQANSPTCRKRMTYSRLIPDSGWGDILGWTMGGGWGIRFSSSISSLEGLRGVKQESKIL